MRGIGGKGRQGVGKGVDKRRGFEERVMMRIPSACSLRSLSAGSAEEHQGRGQALNLIVTLKLLTSSTSPSRVRALFYLKGMVRIKSSLKQSYTSVKEFSGSPCL